MEVSREVNRYTNFGPVSRQLEKDMVRRLGWGADNELSVSVCTNATVGLTAAAGTFAVREDRPMRWAVSAFGFFSTHINVFSNALLVDCDQQGILSLEELARVPGDSYTGVVFTNPFGLIDDWEPIFEYCRKNQKLLIIDNAAGFNNLTEERFPPSGKKFPWIEVFSFHHTKPWGMGEGGAAVVPKAWKPVFEGFLNFGVGLDGKFREYFMNGKISEMACAQILAHHKGSENWVEAYRAQAWRVLEIGKQAGLQPLVDKISEHAVPGQIPFLSPRPVSFDELVNPVLVLQKYYVPHGKEFRNANRIYSHILNVPTHPGVGSVPDRVLSELLQKYL